MDKAGIYSITVQMALLLLLSLLFIPLLMIGVYSIYYLKKRRDFRNLLITEIALILKMDRIVIQYGYDQTFELSPIPPRQILYKSMKMKYFLDMNTYEDVKRLRPNLLPDMIFPTLSWVEFLDEGQAQPCVPAHSKPDKWYVLTFNYDSNDDSKLKSVRRVLIQIPDITAFCEYYGIEMN